MQIMLNELSMIYPSGTQALHKVNLTLEAPNLIGLLGPNGAGKSTLMELLTVGLLPSEGSILLDGLPLSSRERELKAKLGYLPQFFGLYDELTVWQFLDYMAALKGLRNSNEAIYQAIADTGLESKLKVPIRALSGGQRQRVGIAQALLGEPELLILDEPTVGLDPEERVRFRNLFSRMAQNRIVLLSTHIIEDVQSVCNRLIVINKGSILFTGTPEELILLAQGHVGIYLENAAGSCDSGVSVTSRLNTSRGICCRCVADRLPGYAAPAEPTLEEAYLFLIGRGATLP